ncbi:hypothetical protein CEXT_39101 [Caerostris extrusa]|uniref:Uncharacterized protein n=1 Tax=Caerostris extrusa TaxID=172846 RepID=A0AAV4NKZ4_CAEEX|nr:hypothetical protein CEXT_39101 [Caerostris extrusa]
MPHRNGPYVVLSQRTPSSYKIASLDDPQVPIGVYHASAIKNFNKTSSVTPIKPLGKLGHPQKTGQPVSNDLYWFCNETQKDVTILPLTCCQKKV